jgi:S1-C subfamily serine protease
MGHQDGGAAAALIAAGAGAALLIGAVGALGVVALRSTQGPAGPPAPSPTTEPLPTPSSSVSTAPDLAALFAQVKDGVVRIEVGTCYGGGTGSGALVGPDLVVTAAHVVDDAETVQLLVGGSTASGQVIGMQVDRDLALVRSARRFDGHVFDIATTTPDVGTEVVAVGYPLSGSLSLTGPGVVSAHSEEVVYGTEEDPTRVDGLMRTSLLTNRGNSGGPVLDRQGRIVGLVSGGASSSGSLDPVTGEVLINDVNGIDFAVPAGEIAPQVERWRSDPEPVPATECAEDDAEEDVEVEADLVTAVTDDAHTQEVLAVLRDYAQGINDSDYETAHAQLSPARQDLIPLPEFEEQQSSSTLRDVVVLAIEEEGNRLRVRSVFMSEQDAAHGPEGLTCAFWTLEWLLIPGGPNGWQIDGTANVPDQPPYQACSEG